MNAIESDYSNVFCHRIHSAASSLLGEGRLNSRIRELCADYQHQCQDVLTGRGISLLTIAIVGAKGQGKTWLTRQFLLDEAVKKQLPSGVLTSESTTRLHWIGPAVPDDLDSKRELFHYCETDRMADLGRSYMLLDTPGMTDMDKSAAEVARQALGLAPIKLLVTRRDQSRSAVNSQIAAAIDGAICLPIITCVPSKEMSPSGEVSSESLRSDIRQLSDLLSSSAPKSKLLEPILIEDFDASGDESAAGQRMMMQLIERLHAEPLDAIAETRENRLAAANAKLRRSISRIVNSNAPQIATAVRRLHEEADRLPEQVVQSVLGAPVVLQTAVRGRLRAQIVTDTSPLWFPHRAVLSLLSITQGAWDRLILALTGSVPSIFGTLAAWARNVQTSRKISWEMQSGIRDLMNRQIEDRLEPINRQFHLAVHRLRTNDDDSGMPKDLPNVRLAGIEELQSQSRALFEQLVDRHGTAASVLQIVGLISIASFWGMLSGPIVSVYRQYLSASYHSLTNEAVNVDLFPHPPSSLIFTSIFLSVIPVFLFAMFVMTFLLRRKKIERITQQIMAGHNTLIEKLKNEGILRLHYEDRLLEHAEFLVNLDRSHSET